MSSVAWVAVFDILLTFLDNIPGTEDVAYADDIINFSTELAGVQLKADQISEMCAFTGLEISYKKIASFREDGKPAPPDPEPPPRCRFAAGTGLYTRLTSLLPSRRSSTFESTFHCTVKTLSHSICATNT
jgi:hypothetical protein